MSRNLLIVDDEPQVCRALTRLLRPDGYSISHALSPVEGLQLLNEQPFDVVISDYMMPGANGVEFLSEVRQTFPDTIRLMLSGQADMSAVIDAINDGSIFKFVLKPWSNDGLRSLISEAFEKSDEQSEQLDDETGWLSQSRFLDQEIDGLAGAIVVVGEWVDAATCLDQIESLHRHAVYLELSERVERILNLTGELGLIDQGTFAGIAADTMSDQQWQELSVELSKPITAGSVSISGNFRLGLSHVHSEDLKTPLKQALIAAGDAVTGGFQMYTKELGSEVHLRRTLESDLHHAIERDELFYELQPLLHTKSQKISAAESLLRWQHPRLGVISPMEVIDLAEKSDLIDDIGRWSVERCCQLIKRWSDAGDTTSRVTVNVSPRQFLSGNVVNDIRNLVVRHKIDPQRLEIEITESCIMSSPEECAALLQSLADTGVQIAVDDFGTGHSSHETLSGLPINTLKVDRSLISELTSEASAAYSLLHHVIQLAKSLSLSVVAEGIETREQADLCTDLGCDYLQGYLISKPGSAKAFAQLRDKGI